MAGPTSNIARRTPQRTRVPARTVVPPHHVVVVGHLGHEAPTNNLNLNGGTPKPVVTQVPATPGVPTPPIQPFLTGQELIQQSTQESNTAQALAKIDRDLADLRTNNETSKGSIDRNAVQSRSNADDSDAARGVYDSSIHAADIWDIDSTAALRKQQLDNQLSLAATRADTDKANLASALTQFHQGMNQTATENAAAASSGQPQWQVAPVAAHTVTVPPTVFHPARPATHGASPKFPRSPAPGPQPGANPPIDPRRPPARGPNNGANPPIAPRPPGRH